MRRNRGYRLAGLGLGVFLLGAAGSATAQIRFDRGQDVGPTFEGWHSNPDGTSTMYFGYLNRNAEEALHVPIGPDNNFDQGDPDRGQPTYFHPGRRWWVFSVVVPADWPKDRRLTWSLTTRGRTHLARGWLQDEWEVDTALIIGNTNRDPFFTGGVSGAGVRDNQPPFVTASSPAQTVRLPDTATIGVSVSDDGVPVPVPGARRPVGVWVRWILYRGPEAVRFSPETTSPTHGEPVRTETAVTFSAPGEYRLRALIFDGGLFSTHDVDVTVLAGEPAG